MIRGRLGGLVTTAARRGQVSGWIIRSASTSGSLNEAAAEEVSEVPASASLRAGYDVRAKKNYEKKMKELRKQFMAEVEEQRARQKEEEELELARIRREKAQRKVIRDARTLENEAKAAKERQYWHERRALMTKNAMMKEELMRRHRNFRRLQAIMYLEKEAAGWITPENVNEMLTEDMFKQTTLAGEVALATEEETEEFKRMLGSAETDFASFDLDDEEDFPFSKPFTLKDDSKKDDDEDLFSLPFNEDELKRR